jgi:hypothetical protein
MAKDKFSRTKACATKTLYAVLTRGQSPCEVPNMGLFVCRALMK